MIRLFFKRRTLKRQRLKILKTYAGLLYALQSVAVRSEVYTSTFVLTLPKRQQFFNIIDLIDNKSFGFSSGKQLSLFGRKAKFFKRSAKNIAPVVLQLKSTYDALFRNMYLFFIKNFNRRQMLFLKKFNALVKPGIRYLVHKQSYIPRLSPEGRLKRKIQRLINQK